MLHLMMFKIKLLLVPGLSGPVLGEACHSMVMITLYFNLNYGILRYKKKPFGDFVSNGC